ncbi:MAG: tRNA pseudouridine(38-40) synthase TruA [Bacteroidota bacterium]|nr:tRNA pseudouridine(38-40) synthase TruA [Bacteroidota bacterium]
MRYFIELAYNGTNYHGWQIQPNANTVQYKINYCLSTLLNKEVKVIGASRTDTGVHAEQMYAHFDIENFKLTKSFIQRVDNFLPQDITIFKIFSVNHDMHARFSAIRRTYKYYISRRKNLFNPNRYVYFRDLNIDLMNQACKFLLSKHDFTSFSKSNTQTHHNNCEVFQAQWDVVNSEIIFTISADRFLRNMVRAILGTLILVGEEKISPEEIEHILIKKDRSFAGRSVPANGLFLTNIIYSN